MNKIEYKVKTNLLKRGFTEERLFNNRGLIGATIDETVQEIVKNINYDTVLPTAICCNAMCDKPVHKEGSVYCEFHASL